MESVVKVASYIAQRYRRDFSEKISEMKLHKLLYFTQRECIIQNGEPMFPEVFFAWRYGPVVPVVRGFYASDTLSYELSHEAQDKYCSVFDYVFANYAPKDAWSLSRLTHEELSWVNARRGLSQDQNGTVAISVDDIMSDAQHAKNRRYIIDFLNKTDRI